MPLLQFILETGGMIAIGLVVVTQLIYPLWTGKKLFWLFRPRRGQARVEVIPPGNLPHASKHSLGHGTSSSAPASHEQRNR